MTIDEQITALNTLIAKEKMRLVRAEVRVFSKEYLNLVAERETLTVLKETKGGAFETDLSVSLLPKPTVPLRSASLDGGETPKASRGAQALAFLAAAKNQAFTSDESQRQLRAGSY